MLNIRGPLKLMHLKKSGRKDQLPLWLLAAALPLALLPGTILDALIDPWNWTAGAAVREALMETSPGEPMRFEISGESPQGEHRTRHVSLTVQAGDNWRERLKAMGMVVRFEPRQGGEQAVVDDVVFASAADRKGIYFEDRIVRIATPADRPSRGWFYAVAALLTAGAVWRWRGFSMSFRRRPESRLQGMDPGLRRDDHKGPG